MFHRQVIGVPSRNLDTFFSGADQIRELYGYDRENFTYSVIEGAMGLYDGLGGTQKEGSAYHLAQTLDLPVVLVLDARGMGRTMVALLAGILQYDRDHRIIGVILNRTSEGFCRTMTPVIEKELGLPVLGCFPVQKNLHLESRHLGLKMPQEMEGLRKQVNQAAEKLEETADLDRMLQLLQSWALLHAFRDGKTKLPKLQEPGKDKGVLQKKEKQQEADALLLGGGYPELCARQLSENVSMRNSVREAIENGMPSVAECGGFMYLHESMTDEEGENWPMAGVITGNCHNRGKLVRFGYVNVMEQTSHFLAGKPVRAHEFHYYDSDNNGESCVAVKPVSGTSWTCIHEDDRNWWGYPHLYYPSNPTFVEHFVQAARLYHRERNAK